MDVVFDYEDIQLIPAKCIVDSRSECDTSVKLGKHTFRLPVVPANMQTIIDEKIAIQLAEGGYFYIMHRFDPASRPTFIRDMHSRGLIASISVGVKEDEYGFVEQLAQDSLIPDYITIDIAHGHSNAVIRMIQHIKSIYLRVLLSQVTLVHQKLFVNWKTLALTQLKLESGQVKYVSRKSRPVSVQVAGSSQHFVGVLRLHLNRLSQMVESVHMATSRSLSVSVLAWS